MTATSGRDGRSAQQARDLFFANLRSLHIDPELERAVRRAEQERRDSAAPSHEPRRDGVPGTPGVADHRAR